jgi:hypothetical protein
MSPIPLDLLAFSWSSLRAVSNFYSFGPINPHAIDVAFLYTL